MKGNLEKKDDLPWRVGFDRIVGVQIISIPTRRLVRQINTGDVEADLKRADEIVKEANATA